MRWRRADRAPPIEPRRPSRADRAPPTERPAEVYQSSVRSPALVQVVGIHPKGGKGNMSKLRVRSGSWGTTVFAVALSVGCAAADDDEVRALRQAVVASIDVRVSSGIDDVEESAAGEVSRTSSDIELVADGTRGNQTVGLRFRAIGVPQGATIVAARLRFVVDEPDAVSTSLQIRAHAVDDAPEFSTATRNVSSRPLTTASTMWAPPSWSTVGQTQDSPDLTSVVQEVISRAGWVSGNDMALILTGVGERTGEAFEGSASTAPLLHIEFETTPPAFCGDSLCNGGEDCASCEVDCGPCSTGGSSSGGSSSGGAASGGSAAGGSSTGGASSGGSSTGGTSSGGGSGQTFVISARINAGVDDVEERQNGTMSTNSSDIELVEDGSAGRQTVGLRFPALGIPQGAQITSAYLEMVCDETDTKATALTVRAHNTDNAPAFSSTSANVSSRPMTSASVAWSPAAWSTVGAAYQSPNLASVVQEVVNRAGFTSSSALALIIRGTGERTAEAYEGVPASAARLRIEYQIPSGGGSGGSGTGGQGSGGSSGCQGLECGEPTDPDLLVAFIGDQGNNGNSTEVLSLILAEGADAVVHNGDFDYADNPTAWDDRITNVLGESYPYFSIVGNHDAAAWSGTNGYAAKIAARHAKNAEMQCTGELGVQASCYFRGLHMIQSCVGTQELRSSCAANSSEQVSHIQNTLASSSAIFKVCSWHKNQRDMQVGSKGDEVGWLPYQVCMDAGAIVSTGHEHSYSRTLNLTDVGNAGASHGAVGPFAIMTLTPGQNFAFVSGLAGVDLRPFTTSHNSDTWWASYYTSDRWYKNGTLMSGGSNYGALFIRFHVNGDPTLAHAYFKDISGRLADEFDIRVQ